MLSFTYKAHFAAPNLEKLEKTSLVSIWYVHLNIVLLHSFFVDGSGLAELLSNVYKHYSLGLWDHWEMSHFQSKWSEI